MITDYRIVDANDKHGYGKSVSSLVFKEKLATGKYYLFGDGIFGQNSVPTLLSKECHNSNEIYKDYMREENKIRKRLSRMTKCCDENGRRCKASCRHWEKKGQKKKIVYQCPKYDHRPVHSCDVSIDSHQADYAIEVECPSPFVEDLVVEQIMAAERQKKLRDVSPELLEFAKARNAGQTVAHISEKRLIGKSGSYTVKALAREKSRGYREIDKFIKEGSKILESER
jgi:hypothetical protein